MYSQHSTAQLTTQRNSIGPEAPARRKVVYIWGQGGIYLGA